MAVEAARDTQDRMSEASAKISDVAFHYDEEKLDALASAKPWLAE
jgi:hypothetical protein